MESNASIVLKAAQANYQSDDVDVGDDAKVCVSDTGYWVEAYVWVSDDDVADYQKKERVAAK